MNINRAFIGGNLGADPEVTDKGATRLSIATNEKYVNKQTGEIVSRTQWHRVTAWGKLGENIAKYFRKGDEIFIEGKIEYFKHEEKYYTSIIANSFEFVGKSSGGNSQPLPPSPESQQDRAEAKARQGSQSIDATPIDENDDLPF